MTAGSAVRTRGDARGKRRFALEVVKAVRGAWPPEKVGFTMSPGGNHKGIRDEDPVATFKGLAGALSAAGLGWIQVADLLLADQRPSSFIRRAFRGALIVSEGYARDTAEEALQAGTADLAFFGRAFTANPDLVKKLRPGERLIPEDPLTYYTAGRAGYVE